MRNNIVEDDGGEAAQWVIKVIESCNTSKQLRTAKKVVDLWYNKYFSVDKPAFQYYLSKIDYSFSVKNDLIHKF